MRRQQNARGKAIFLYLYSFARFSLAISSVTQLEGFVQIFKSLNPRKAEIRKQPD